MPRTRWIAEDECAAGGGDSIALSWTAPTNSRLVALHAHFATTPTTSENFVAFTDAAASSRRTTASNFDVVHLTVDPGADSIDDIDYSPDGEVLILKGDVFKATYTNTDDVGIGVEAIFAPVD